MSLASAGEVRNSTAIDIEGCPVREFGRADRAIKRAFDLTVVLLTLPFVLPIVAVVGVAVALSSRGPVFYVQERVGRGGETFRLVKFRTMRAGTDRQLQDSDLDRRVYEQNDYKLRRDDPRITPVGRVLRATSVDELPQLLNVLRGEMSVVGIRPVLVPELALRSDYEQTCYRALRPGMTGLWQVKGRSSVQSADRRALDCEYVERWSLRRDVGILFRTPLAVLRVQHAH